MINDSLSLHHFQSFFTSISTSFSLCIFSLFFQFFWKGVKKRLRQPRMTMTKTMFSFLLLLRERGEDFSFCFLLLLPFPLFPGSCTQLHSLSMNGNVDDDDDHVLIQKLACLVIIIVVLCIIYCLPPFSVCALSHWIHLTNCVVKYLIKVGL